VRVLGIDVGTSRTGVAISDPLGVTCTPLPVIRERERDKTLLKVVAVATEYGVGEIVVGLPRPLGGGTNEQLHSVVAFAERLATLAELPILTWDERFTSKLAESAANRSGEQDSVAACYMLQDYLDWRSRNLAGDKDE
jgi:putative Holliday junction resolvase